MGDRIREDTRREGGCARIGGVMFESLTDKLTGVLDRLTNRGRLSERDVDEALREVRLALLGADVNFRVAREFVARVRERSVGREVLESITPGQQVVKIVHEELTSVLSAGEHKLTASSRAPTTLMLVGLQGSGKTTTAAKLAAHLRRDGQSSLLVAADLRRAAAVQQLVSLGKQMAIPVYSHESPKDAVEAASAGVERATELGSQWAIVDTGGRLHVDEEMMEELEEVHRRISPHEVILVLDAMTGQDAVQAAEEFHRRVPLTGIILTKLDGDARGRRGAFGDQGHGDTDQVPGNGGAGGRAGPLLSGQAGVADFGDGGRVEPGGEGAAGGGQGSGEGDGAEAAAGELRPGGLSGAVAEREADGVFGAVHGDDSGVFQDEQAASRRGDRRWGVEEG